MTKQTTDNGDGTQTTKQTTYHPDGSIDTKITQGPKPSGAAAAASGSGDGMSTFCKDNPNSSICKTSNFGGTCGAAFTCDGDAVQCAIAKEQHERDCAFYDPASQQGTIGQHAGKFNQALTDGDVPSWSPVSPTNQASKDIDFQTQIKTDKHWGSSCPADAVIAGVNGTRYVIPWSSWCDQMAMIGKLVLAVSWIVCLGIVFKN